MTEKIQKYLRFNEALGGLIDEALSRDVIGISNKDAFMLYAISKGRVTHKACLMLCKNGYGEDAFMLARTLFELSLLTEYLLQEEGETRLLKYAEYDFVIRKEMFDFVKDSQTYKDKFDVIINGDFQESFKEVNEGYERVKGNYQANRPWVSISEMAKAVGKKEEYGSLYKLQCIMGHSNPRSMNEYLKEVGDNLHFKNNPDFNYVDITLVALFDNFISIVKAANGSFNLGLDEKIHILDEEFLRSD